MWTIRLSIFESNDQKPWVADIRDRKLLFIEDGDHRSGTANSFYFCKCFFQNISRE